VEWLTMVRGQFVILVSVGATIACSESKSRGQAIIYVDGNASGGSHNGSSWCNAYVELQPALASAISGTTIRVADGVYHPDPTGLPNPRSATFQLENAVALEGGYAGCGAPNPNVRNTNPSATIFSGDILGNDPSGNEFRDCCNATYLPGCPDAACAAAVCAQHSLCCDIQWEQICAETAQTACAALCDSRDDNSYHVVTGSATDATAVLDGVIITLGSADVPTFPSEDAKGAGMYAQGGSPTIRNCLFRGNDARELGGGLYARNGGPQVTSCTFEDNRSRNYNTEGAASGAGACVENGNPAFTGCTFTANTVDVFGQGAGILLNSSAGTIQDCRFTENLGAAIEAIAGNPVIERCRFMGNTAAILLMGGTPSVRHCLILGNYYAIVSSGGAPEIVNSLIVGNISGGSGGGISCSSSSATILDCTIVGNTAPTNGGGVYLGGNGTSRVQNCIVWGNMRQSQPSQVYLQPFSPSSIPTLTVSYSDVQGGQGGVGGSGTLIWGAGNIDQDPLFLDADGADGVVGNEDDNLRVRQSSPCIDAGDNSAVPAFVTVDLDGRPRVIDADNHGGAVVDMGAYEAPKPIPVLGGWGTAVLMLSLMVAGTILVVARSAKASPA
jgi:hypothetical protein